MMHALKIQLHISETLDAKIDAIKVIRMAFGLGLVESKTLVDHGMSSGRYTIIATDHEGLGRLVAAILDKSLEDDMMVVGTQPIPDTDYDYDFRPMGYR